MKTNRKRPTSLEPISAAVFVIVSLHLAAVFGVWHWWQNLSNARLQAHNAQQLAWMNPADFAPPLPPPAAVPRAIALSPSAAAAAARALKKSPAPAKPAAVTPTKSATMPLNPPVDEDPPVQKATLIAGPPQQHVMEPVPNPTATSSGAPPAPGSSTASAMAPAPLFAGAALTPKPSANRSITLRRAPEKRTGTPTFGAPAPPMTSPTLMDIARLNALRPSAVPPPDATAPAPEVNLDAVDEAVNADFLAGWIAPPIDGVPEGQREGRLNISIGKDGTVLKAQMSKFSGSHVLDQSILEAASKVKKISTTLPSNFAKDSYDLELNFMLLP